MSRLTSPCEVPHSLRLGQFSVIAASFHSLGYCTWRSILILCLRALSPLQIVLFPCTFKYLTRTVLRFSIVMFLCAKKVSLLLAVEVDHGLLF